MPFYLGNKLTKLPSIYIDIPFRARFQPQKTEKEAAKFIISIIKNSYLNPRYLNNLKNDNNQLK